MICQVVNFQCFTPNFSSFAICVSSCGAILLGDTLQRQLATRTRLDSDDKSCRDSKLNLNKGFFSPVDCWGTGFSTIPPVVVSRISEPSTLRHGYLIHLIYFTWIFFLHLFVWTNMENAAFSSEKQVKKKWQNICKYISTLPETNSHFAPENRPSLSNTRWAPY